MHQVQNLTLNMARTRSRSLRGWKRYEKDRVCISAALPQEDFINLVYEIVDNSVDEALAGYCDEIQVDINKDGSVTVSDNGRGIPVGINHKAGLPAVEVVFTVLHAGGKIRRRRIQSIRRSPRCRCICCKCPRPNGWKWRSIMKDRYINRDMKEEKSAIN